MTGSEMSRADVKEVKSESAEGYREIRPEKIMSTKELNDAVNDEFKKAYIDEDNNEDKAKENLDPSHKDCMTTSEERKNFAKHGDGDWDGEPGDSIFHPNKQEAKEALDKYGQDGIEYKDGEPDFSKVSEATVSIDNMTSERYGPGNNFDQANQKCAKKWNAEAKDGKTNWTARDVEKWRYDNHYSWHERLDRKTMDLVQRDVHDECKHYGGIAECRRYEAAGKPNGGGFDA